jgi:hypothetical protein
MDAHAAPLVVAGDVFDRWNAGPEVINFALDHLPPCYAVPGQHDLPNHDYNAMGRSAYGTLVRAGHITNLGPRSRHYVNGVYLFGHPWGHAIEPPAPLPTNAQPGIRLAVVHEYIWHTKATAYPGAPPAKRAAKRHRDLAGYDAAVFGDNHKGFLINRGRLFNAGGMMRRRTDEVNYQPRYGLLHDDGTISAVPFDTSADVIDGAHSEAAAVETALDLTGFIAGLDGLGGVVGDYRSEVCRYMDTHGTDDAVRAAVLEALGG